MNNNIFLVLVLALLSGCSTVKSDRSPQPIEHALNPVDCTSGVKREECLAVANFDKKAQKKTVKPTQSEQMDRRARAAKIIENKKINDEKAKVKIEASPLVQDKLPPDESVVSKPDPKTQKQIDLENRQKAFSASMDCVKYNIGKKDDIRTQVRAVAYELALLCRKQGVQVDSIANATVPLIEQSRAPKNKK